MPEFGNHSSTPVSNFSKDPAFEPLRDKVRFEEPTYQKRSKSSAIRKPANKGGRRDIAYPSWMNDNPKHKRQGSRTKSSRPVSTKHSSRTPTGLELTPMTGLDMPPEQSVTHDTFKENGSSYVPMFYTPTASTTKLDISDLNTNNCLRIPSRYPQGSNTQPYSLLNTYNRDDFKVPKTLKIEEYSL